MKPEELMIGDIVNVHRCECVADGGQFQEWDEYGKVVSITEYYITIKYIGREEDYGFEDVYGEDINPIPLTPEILEKNGWFPLDEYRYEGDIALAKGRDYFRLKNTTICINSVHELQHALRLCGINKEVEL